ncbi:MAG: bifunctional DNA primase/polymerase [Anaerolineaceae bacterium]|nr:bifunctional DNA primase/polymerase [Anaerolineaceae bacterium]
MASSILDHAVEMAWEMLFRGYSVIPIIYRQKSPKVQWEKYQIELTDPRELERWAKLPANFAVLTGSSPIGEDLPGLVVIDFDNLDDYFSWLDWAESANPISTEATRAFTVMTARGMHVYLTSPQAGTIRNTKFIEVDKAAGEKYEVDLKGAGGYVMLPGSIHPSGAVYEVASSGSFYAPSFERLDEVLPPFILSRIGETRAMTPAQGVWTPTHTERESLSDIDVLDRPANTGTLFERARRSHRIEEFLPPAGVIGSNGWYKVKCPFHEDQNASFAVNASTQYCKCLAGCTGSKMYDVVNLYSRLKGINLISAAIELVEM